MSSEKQPFFSVVIPLYNKQNHVKETLETVFSQTFQDFEIVIVNDGSTDNSAKIVESIDDNRIRVIHQDNTGVSVARNRGIKEANADYIAFLDADDIWLPEYLKTIYELIQNYPDAGLYATAYKILENQEYKTINILGLPTMPYSGYVPNYFKCRVLGSSLVWTSAVCIPRKVFFENNIWFPEGEKYGEDQHVWGRIALEKKLACDTRECAVYVKDAENNTVDITSNLRMPQDTIMNLKRYKYKAYNADILKWFDFYIEKYLLGYIIRNKNYKDVNNVFKILMRYKFSFKGYIKASLIALMPYMIFDYIKNKRRNK